MFSWLFHSNRTPPPQDDWPSAPWFPSIHDRTWYASGPLVGERVPLSGGGVGFVKFYDKTGRWRVVNLADDTFFDWTATDIVAQFDALDSDQADAVRDVLGVPPAQRDQPSDAPRARTSPRRVTQSPNNEQSDAMSPSNKAAPVGKVTPEHCAVKKTAPSGKSDVSPSKKGAPKPNRKPAAKRSAKEASQFSKRQLRARKRPRTASTVAMARMAAMSR